MRENETSNRNGQLEPLFRSILNNWAITREIEIIPTEQKEETN